MSYVALAAALSAEIWEKLPVPGLTKLWTCLYADLPSQLRLGRLGACAALRAEPGASWRATLPSTALLNARSL